MASRYPTGNNYGGGSLKENGHAKDSGKDNVFDLDSAAFASDEFRMNEFKVKRCPRARPHDWTQCPFAHPGEKARRRNPRRYKYSGTACPEFRKSGCCRRGDACPFAHGVFECWLHPSRYRTQLCTDGTNCKRRVCFFAHVESELRHPEDDPGVAQRQVQAELAAEVQTLQQQHLTQALQALLIQTTLPISAPERPPPQMPALTLEMLKQTDVPAPELMEDTSNSTAALQLALLQQLAAKEQQLQQHTNDKSNDVSVSVPDNGFNGASSSTVRQPDVYDTLSQLKQLSLSAAAPIVSSPAVCLSFDPTTLLSQLMPNGTPSNGVDLHSQSLLIDSLLTQNGTKLNGQTRRSIDNSYLPSLLPDASAQSLGSMGIPMFPNGGYLNQMKQETPPPVQIPASNGSYPVVSGGQMYSVENIQRLMQNPAFSSNLSQLLQMNPSLLQQLTTNPTETGNPGRRSIDNAYLTRLNTGYVHNGVGMAPTEHASPEPLLMNGLTNDGNKMMQGGMSSDSLLQEFNALHLQLVSNQGTNTALSGVSVGSDGYIVVPPHSSPDSDANSSSGAHPMSQSLTEDN